MAYKWAPNGTYSDHVPIPGAPSHPEHGVTINDERTRSGMRDGDVVSGAFHLSSTRQAPATGFAFAWISSPWGKTAFWNWDYGIDGEAHHVEITQTGAEWYNYAYLAPASSATDDLTLETTAALDFNPDGPYGSRITYRAALVPLDVSALGMTWATLGLTSEAPVGTAALELAQTQACRA